jgi:hypothetical protein
MAPPSALQARRRGRPRARYLPLLLLLCAWPLADARGQTTMDLTVKVKAVDANGNPVPNAQVFIDRQGTYKVKGKAANLPDLTGVTGPDGVYTSPTVKTFALDGKDDKLTVTAPAYQAPFETHITDRMLQDAAARKEPLYIETGKTIVVPLEPETGPLFIGVRDEGGRPVPKAEVALFYKTKNADGQDEDAEVGRWNAGPDGNLRVEQFKYASPQYIIKAAAAGFDPITNTVMTDELRNAKDRPFAVTLPRTIPFLTTLLARLRGLFDYLLWFCGWAFVSLLLLGVVGYALGLRLWYYRVRSDRRSTYQLVEELLRRVENLPAELKEKGNALPEVAEPTAEDKTLTSTSVTTERGPAKKRLHFKEGELEPNDVNPSRVSEAADEPAGGGGQSARGKEDGGGPTGAPYAGAQSSYVGLINRRPVMPEPIYLDVEGARSIAGKLEDSNVYLSPVPHSQGALVLFIENGEAGWVFPNPTINFRQEALKEVFPRLTEAEFAATRESIRPRRVTKVEERRWLVEPASTA